MTEHEESGKHEEPDSQVEPKEAKESEGELHRQTHFSVEKKPIDSKGYNSGYEWVDCGRGHWKLVPKKAKN